MAARACLSSKVLLSSAPAFRLPSVVLRCSGCGGRTVRRKTGTRLTSTLPAPEPDGTPKEYPEKIQNIVKEISQLTLLEVSELNELLKSKLKIVDAPAMPMMAMAQAPAQEAEPEPVKKEATEFTIKLINFDASSKVKLIKEIKNLMPDMNLVQAKKFVESLPQVIKEKGSKKDIEEIKKSIEAAGGVVEIQDE